MGVLNLWRLLQPCGRRVAVETLRGQILAVDVSIWLTQFVKAMRDDEGQMTKNAHLVGTFRRICKVGLLGAALRMAKCSGLINAPSLSSRDRWHGCSSCFIESSQYLCLTAEPRLSSAGR